MANNLETKREIARLKQKIERLESELQLVRNSDSHELAYLKHILEHTNIGVVIHNFKQVVYANKPIQERLQLKEEELLGMNPSIFVPYEARSIIVERLNRLRNNQAVEPMEQTFQLPSGKTAEVVVTGFPVTYHNEKAVLLIITDRTGEKKMALENKKLLEILEEIPATIIVTDKDSKIEYVNRFFVDHSGYSKGEAIGKKPSLISSGIYSPEHYKKMFDIIMTGSVYKGQMLNRKKNGDNYWDEVRIKAIFDENGKVQSFFSIQTDITDKIETIEELKAVKEQLNQRIIEKTKELEEKNKVLERSRKALALMLEDLQEQRAEMKRVNEELMEANQNLDAFNSSISHDLKAPANRIINLATLLKDIYGQKMEEAAMELVGDIISSAGEMEKLVENMLLFSRAGLEEPDVVDINMRPLIEAVFEEEQENFNRPDAVLKTGAMYPFEADYPLIKQVVYNLISNAFKYSKPDIPLEINVYSELIDSGRFVTYYFSDNGIGFSGDEGEKIFDFLYRTPEAQNKEGTGIGLAIVKKIILRHKGSLSAKGERGKGATISFTVPVLYKKYSEMKTEKKETD